jgi:predicted ATP-dependent protease
MTGEITTLGEVISIGGVREKLTACKNHQISRVILPLSNRKNVTKLPEEFKRGFTIFYVKNIEQAYKILFESEDQIQKGDFSQLKDIGVVVEKYEEDTVSKVLIDQEKILQKNFLEELL